VWRIKIKSIQQLWFVFAHPKSLTSIFSIIFCMVCQWQVILFPQFKLSSCCTSRWLRWPCCFSSCQSHKQDLQLLILNLVSWSKSLLSTTSCLSAKCFLQCCHSSRAIFNAGLLCKMAIASSRAFKGNITHFFVRYFWRIYPGHYSLYRHLPVPVNTRKDWKPVCGPSSLGT